MQSAADLLHAVAALAWPLLVLILFIVYRPDVQKLLARLKRGKVLGQDLEFGLDRLEAAADSAELSADQVVGFRPGRQPEIGPSPAPPVAAKAPQEEDSPPPVPESVPEAGRTGIEQPQARTENQTRIRPLLDLPDPEPSILDEAAVSPKLALIKLSGELERAMRRLLAATGESPDTLQRASLPRLASRLSASPSIQSAVTQFSDVRNKIVHGSEDNVDDDAALRAVDSGLKILRTLRTLPVTGAHVVLHPAVEVYADAEGANLRPTKAVVIENIGAEPRMQAFPTRRDYVRGQAVTWEWEFTTVWGESWYRDPDTGELAYAWTNSAEFAGRPIEELT